MLIVRWLVLWERAEQAQTSLSIIPAARHVAAPYPVHCKITLVGGGKHGASIVLEGPKVNQPAQVVLEELFPPETLATDSTGSERIRSNRELRGVLVELLPTRRSLDLSLSRAFVERAEERFSGSPSVVRYIPCALAPLINPSRSHRSTPRDLIETQRQRLLPLFLNPDTSVQLVAINSGGSTGTVGLELLNLESEESVRHSEGVAPDSGTIAKSVVDVHVDAGVCVDYPLTPVAQQSAPEAYQGEEARCAIGLLEASNSEDVALYCVERSEENGLLNISSL